MSIPYAQGEALTCQQIRELDILAIEHIGLPGLVLMENAARAAAEFVYGLLPDPPRSQVVLLCGPGNNGGDGFAAARHLLNAQVRCTVVLAAPREKVRGDAEVNLRVLERLDSPLIHATTAESAADLQPRLEAADVIVDALLGTGARGAPAGVMADLIRSANAAARPRRVAIDIPTGLDAEMGEVADPCFRADATVTFVAAKIGFASPEARAVLGRVVVADIGVPRTIIPGMGRA